MDWYCALMLVIPKVILKPGTTWTDLSGRGNTGTLTNGPTYSSANGGSIVFDGTNDYVSTNYTQTSVTGYTIDVWFKSTDTGTQNPFVQNRGVVKVKV